MRNFTRGQYVKVLRRDHPLQDRCGVCVRPRKADNGWWVNMDTPLPDELLHFGPEDERRKHALLYPEDCCEPFE